MSMSNSMSNITAAAAAGAADRPLSSTLFDAALATFLVL
jgi:hypothetical protein